MASPKELMEIGNRIVSMCNEGRDTECLEFYTQDAVSAEAMPMPGQESAEAVGLEAIRGKHEWWFGAHEVHKSEAQGPYIHGDNRFSVIFNMDVTNKETGERSQMQEVGQYFVNQDGQIYREEFSYAIEA